MEEQALVIEEDEDSDEPNGPEDQEYENNLMPMQFNRAIAKHMDKMPDVIEELSELSQQGEKNKFKRQSIMINDKKRQNDLNNSK